MRRNLGLLGLEAGDWIDRVSPPPGELARWAGRLAHRLDACQSAEEARRALDAVLVPLLHDAAPLDAMAAEAVRRIEASDGRQPIRELAECLEISQRQLQRRFGSSPACRAAPPRSSGATSRVSSTRTWRCRGGRVSLEVDLGAAGNSNLILGQGVLTCTRAVADMSCI